MGCAAGFGLGGAHAQPSRPAIVLDDEKKARAIGLRGQRYFTEAIRHWYNPGGDAPPPRAEIADMSDEEALRADGEELIAYLHEEKIEVGTEATGLFTPNHAYGSGDDAIGYVERLIQAGADEIMFIHQMGTVPHEAIVETIENIGKHVIPHFNG